MHFFAVTLVSVIVYGVKAAVLPQLVPETDICLCLGGGEHCFSIGGTVEDNFLITALADNVNIHLPLNDFVVSPKEACTKHVRKTRSTDIDASTSDKGSHVGVDHQSGNTHVHGSVDVDKNGHVSGSGGFEHSHGNVDTHGSVSVDKDGHTHYEGGATIHIGRK